MNQLERYCSHCGAATLASDVACAACGTSLKVTRPLDQKRLLEPSAQRQPPELRLAVHLQTLQLFNERYRIVRQVGVGGFGAVYEAADTWEPKRVAIKEISLTGLSAQQVIEATGSFNREVQMLSCLHHTGIPRMYEQSTDAQHWYLIMEFIAGKTLEATLDQAPGRRLSLEQVLSIGIQVCSVLEYLHTQRPAVIFRDIKPANIMLTPEGHLYLIDFGVARRYQPGSARDTIAFGSPGYAAPEQYGRAQTTPLSDIYSLGALLYCLLSGDDPADHPFQFPALRFSGVEGIREMDALLQRMLATDPARRPQGVRIELQRIQQMLYQVKRRAPIWIPPRGQTPPALAALSKTGSQKPVVPLPQNSASVVTTSSTSSGQQQQQVMLTSPAPPAQAPGASKQSAGRKTTRRRVVLGGAIAFGGFLSVGIINILHNRQSTLPVTNALPTANSGLPGHAQATESELSDQPTPAAKSQGPVIPVNANGVTYWSPDLSYAIVFVNGSDELAIYSVKEQTLLQHFSPDTPLIGTPLVMWAPDSSKFFFCDDLSGGSVWNVSQNKQEYPVLLGTLAAWSPDSRYLTGVGMFSSENNVLYLYSAMDGNELFQASFDGLYTSSYLAWSPNSRYLVFPPSAGNNWRAGQKWSLDIWDMQAGVKVSQIGGQLPDETGSLAYPLSGLAWSPDNATIAVVLNNDLWLISMSAGMGVPGQVGTRILKAAVATNSAGFTTNNITWSPNSRYLAISQDEYNGGLNVYAVASGKNLLSVAGIDTQIAVGLTWASDSKSLITADGHNILSTWKIG